MGFKPVEIRPPRAPLANAGGSGGSLTPVDVRSCPSPPPPPPTSPSSGALPQYDLPSTSTYTIAATAPGLPPGAAPPITAPIRFARTQSYDALSRSAAARSGRPMSMYSTPEAGTSTPVLVSSARSWALHDLPEKPSPSAPPPRDPLPRDAEPEPATQSPKSPKSEGGGMLAFLSRILKGRKKSTTTTTVTPFPIVMPLPAAAPRRAASVSTPNLGTSLPTPPRTPPRRESVTGHTHSVSDTEGAGTSAMRQKSLPSFLSLPPTPPNGVAALSTAQTPNDRLSPGPRPNTDEGTQDPQSIASSASASPPAPASPGGGRTHPHRRSVVFTTPPGILLNKGEGTVSRKLQKKRK
ncbi:uncharacterized protein LOC62_04G006115 [Vanrija pseudolonga]|uniref:Uncharacterized protein n=1 Tax=Vanrija pseudolonga TaxID=143232 RepID=A0AAF1BJD9_9TREE|nr:hypothetical protein LOC62_04G006115 [Vanrija pseudolonga]